MLRSAVSIMARIQNTQDTFIGNSIVLKAGFPIFRNARQALLWYFELAVMLALRVIVESPIGHAVIEHISMRCVRIRHAMTDCCFYNLCW